MQRFYNFLDILTQSLPGFSLKFKNESTLMKVIGCLMFFNRAFMTGFITTIGKTVYWPTREKLESRSETSTIEVLAHEYQHAKDVDKRPVLFNFGYLFPQVLAAPGVLMVLAAPVWVTLMLLNVISWSWYLLPFLLTLLFLLPLPAPGRMHYELKGYIMSLFSYSKFLQEHGYSDERRKEILLKRAVRMNSHFTGPNYYFMWPFGVEKQLRQAVEDIMSEEILQKDPIYSEVAKAIKDTFVE
jgi:hypothetical protein